MPLCYFRPREAAHDFHVLGWVDRDVGRVVPIEESLADLLEMRSRERNAHIRDELRSATTSLALEEAALLAPVDEQEIWAAGVTYERSRDARMEESRSDDLYDRVYTAERPEIFFKSPAYRCMGPFEPVAVRPDSVWNVPEPELALVVDGHGEIAGYTIGNDVSSRSIEGENALYLPQAKIYTASCALGPWIVLADELPDTANIAIRMTIERGGSNLWSGETSTAQMRRGFQELIDCLFTALEFPVGVVLMTGTGIVPPDDVSLSPGDTVSIEIEGIGTLTNHARSLRETPTR